MSQNLTFTKRDQVLQVFVFLLTLATGIEVGGATFDDMVNSPIWSQSSQAAKNWTIQTGIFFRIFSPLMALLAIITMIAGWKAKFPLRKWLLIATTLIILCFAITMIYFVPELNSVRGTKSVSLAAAEHMERLDRWQLFDKFRHIAVLAAFIILIHCVGLSYKIKERLQSGIRNAES